MMGYVYAFPKLEASSMCFIRLQKAAGNDAIWQENAL